MKRKANKLVALVLASTMVLATLTGCGKSEEEPKSSDLPIVEEEKENVDTSDTPATTELKDNKITIGYGTAIDSLTPFRANTARPAPYFVQLYETLAVLDENQNVQPYVAKSWETKDNGFTYSVEIWDTVVDSAGNKITAKDIVWFIEESKKRALKPVFASVESVSQTSDYTIEIKLTSNMYGTFESLLFDTFVVSQVAFEASSDEFGSAVVSTSPYSCTAFTASALINFERRDDYWQDIEKLPECVRPLVKNVDYQIITEASQLGIALETGTVDMVIDIASSTGTQFVDSNGFTVDLADGPQGWQMFFSGSDTSPTAEDKLLRQAICYGIDAQGLITGLAAGYGTQMWDVCSPRMIGFQEQWMQESYYEYDLDKAKELLEQSNYNGETITILSTSSAFASRLAQLLQNYLVAMGINCELNSVDMALYTSIRLDGSQYDIVLNTVGGYSLADHWSVRYDPAAYATGDATSRHDTELAELLYSTRTIDGFTPENINKVHNYLKDSAIAYGLVNPKVFTIWSDKANLGKIVKGGIAGYVIPSACQLQ
jgi:ABC-type transport system substrate-binding protein